MRAKASIVVADVLPAVLPLGVFVARRDSFEAIADVADEGLAIAMAFEDLPLLEHGWNPSTTKATRVQEVPGLVWRFERMAENQMGNLECRSHGSALKT